MEDSIFTKIIKGQIPCHKVYEDDQTLAFMDINPLLPGHVLIVSKDQIDYVDDLPDDAYQALFQTAKKVAKQLKAKLGAKRTVTLVMGYDVPHAHVHVIPSDTSQTFYKAIAARVDHETLPEPDHAALAAMAQKLAF